MILDENANSARSHHDGHPLLRRSAAPWCQSTRGRLTPISCARCLPRASRRSWAPRSLRAGALPCDAPAPSAPTAPAGSGNDPPPHGWARSTLASAGSARVPPCPTGSTRVLARKVALATCSRGPLASRGARCPRARTMVESLAAKVRAFRTRPLDTGPSPIVLGGCRDHQGAQGWWDRTRPRARVTGCMREGHREILGVRGCHEQGCGWLACWRSLVACGLDRGGARHRRCTRGPHRGDRRGTGWVHRGAVFRPTSLRDLLATMATSHAALELRSWRVSMRPVPTRLKPSSTEWSRRSQPRCPRLLETSSTPAVACWPCRTCAGELWCELLRTNLQGVLGPGGPPAHGWRGDLPGSSCHHPTRQLAAAASNTEVGR